MRRVAVLALVTLTACAVLSGGDSPKDASVDTFTLDGNGCSTQPCSILPQCGCTADETCDVDTGDDIGTTCRPITANGNEDDTCPSTNDCDRGYVCLGGANPSCKKYCSGNADCMAPRGVCIHQVTGDNGPIAGIPRACSSNCDPVDTTGAGCPSTMKCTLYTIPDNNDTPTNIVDCSPAGTGMQGDDCTATNGSSGVESRCAKGYQCVKLTNESTFKCRRLCNAPGTTTGCNGQMCLAFTPAYTLAGVSYGVCQP
jgi:hypothetical protein